MKKIVTGLFFAVALTGLTACNTVEGVGKDVKATGATVEKVAKDVKEDITD